MFAGLSVLTLCCASSDAATQLSTPEKDDLKQCEASEQTFQHDLSFMQYRGSKFLHQDAPTYLRLMPSRFVDLRRATRGLNCSGVPLVEFDGRRYGPAGFADDLGLYWVVPKVEAHTGLGVAKAFDATVCLVILAGVCLGFAGYWRFSAGARSRLIGAAVFLILGGVQAVAGDVYVFQSAPVIASVPWVVGYAARRDGLKLSVSSILFALCAGFSTVVRSTTGPPCIAFLALLVIGSLRASKAIALFFLIAAAFMLPIVLTRYEIKRRDSYLASIPGSLQYRMSSHVIWHAIYVGFGYWPNSEVPRYSDAVAGEKVRSLKPGAEYFSPEYQAVLRQEVWRIITHKPWIVVMNLVLKVSLLAATVLAVASPAIRIIVRRTKSLWFDGAFAIAILTSALTGVLVTPNPKYVLGMICFVALYALLAWSANPILPSMERAA